jgi:hypothetical protein
VSGAAEIDKMIASLRKLPGEIKAYVPELGKTMQKTLAASADAGTAPDGTPWKRKKDGGRALVNAGAKIVVTALGSVLVAVISGADAIHHYGTKKDPRRQILPVGDMPDTLASAFRAGLAKPFRKAMGGG